MRVFHTVIKTCFFEYLHNSILIQIIAISLLSTEIIIPKTVAQPYLTETQKHLELLTTALSKHEILVENKNLHREVSVHFVLSNKYQEYCLENILVSQISPIVIVMSAGSLLPPSLTSKHQIDSSGNLINPSVKILRHSSHYSTAIIFLSGVQPMNFYPDIFNFQLRSFIPFPFNTHPQQVEHVFIGNAFLVESAYLKYDHLKYKLGLIFPEDGAMAQVLFENCFRTATIKIDLEKFKRMSCLKTDILKNKHLRATGYNFKNHIIRDSKGSPIGGMSFNLIKFVAVNYNSSFHYHHNSWRNVRQNRDGTWNGFIGELINNTEDFASYLGNTYLRHPYLDFTTHIKNSPFVFFSSLPKSQLKWDGILSAFDAFSWLCIILSVLLAIPVFYGYFCLKPAGTVVSPLYVATILPTCAILQEARNIPRTVRHLSGLFLFYSIVINICFSSNLISVLTIPDVDALPETPEELSKTLDIKIKYIQYAGTISDVLFENSLSPTVLSIIRRMEFVKPGEMIQAMIETSTQQGTALFTYEQLGRIHVAENATLKSNFSPVKISTVPITDIQVSIVLRKYSKFTEALSTNVGRLQNTGHVEKWFGDVLDNSRRQGMSWWKQVQLHGGDRTYEKLVQISDEAMLPDVKSFTIFHFVIMFSCLFCGAGVALVVFIIEVFHKNFSKLALVFFNALCANIDIL
ncbi:unnamed protein product [Allacma fusca]|uniref:Ionotropic receptor n=1 Tax=Allacma fusca TaxID=39272 RepID=A0A8J2JJN9_9HEXA|nr:unnamed protein product [Allacma fusca]